MSRRGILFDLDGTLADTAPDLVAVLNQLLAEAGRPPVPYAVARNEVSNGALGLIRLGFRLDADAPVDDALRQRFLDIYASGDHKNSILFISVDSISDFVSRIGGAWGIVTNKPKFLTDPLLEALGVASHTGVVVCGDTLAERKPHPAPLLFAAGELGCKPQDCIYLGDAARDIEAGNRAGMRTIATCYGYIRPTEHVGKWGADATIAHPGDLTAAVGALLEAS